MNTTMTEPTINPPAVVNMDEECDLYITKEGQPKGRLLHRKSRRECIQTRDEWARNGPPEYLTATYEITPPNKTWSW